MLDPPRVPIEISQSALPSTGSDARPAIAARRTSRKACFLIGVRCVFETNLSRSLVVVIAFPHYRCPAPTARTLDFAPNNLSEQVSVFDIQDAFVLNAEQRSTGLALDRRHTALLDAIESGSGQGVFPRRSRQA